MYGYLRVSQGHSLTECAKSTIFWVCFCDVSSRNCRFFPDFVLSASLDGMNIEQTFWVLGLKGQNLDAGDAFRA